MILEHHGLPDLQEDNSSTCLVSCCESSRPASSDLQLNFTSTAPHKQCNTMARYNVVRTARGPPVKSKQTHFLPCTRCDQFIRFISCMTFQYHICCELKHNSDGSYSPTVVYSSLPFLLLLRRLWFLCIVCLAGNSSRGIICKRWIYGGRAVAA